MIFGFFFLYKRFVENANQNSRSRSIKRDVRLKREGGGWADLASVGLPSGSEEDERDESSESRSNSSSS